MAVFRQLGLRLLRWSVKLKFPQVRSISTVKLADWLSQANLGDRQPPILLDTRTASEYEVSHLPKAQRLDPKTPDLTELNHLEPDTPIVTYCSVGVRSAKMVQRLQSAGFTNVFNLDGSIFQWSNEGRPVYRDNQPVQQVHPYNASWGRLLRPELHSNGLDQDNADRDKRDRS
jgi:rhodanese-related sulfurtransferase